MSEMKLIALNLCKIELFFDKKLKFSLSVEPTAKYYVIIFVLVYPTAKYCVIIFVLVYPTKILGDNRIILGIKHFRANFRLLQYYCFFMLLFQHPD